MELGEEKESRILEKGKLEKQISDWELKYEQDVKEV